MHEGDPARSETVPTLEDICVDLIRRHIDRVDDLGPVPDQIVRRLLLHPNASVGSPPRAPTLPAKLTPDVLERVESGTFAGSGRDLAPVTDAVWREFLRRDFPGVTVPPDASNKEAFRRLTAARRRRQADAAARLRATYADAARKKDARVAKVVHLAPRAPRRPAVSLPTEAAAAAAKRARVENAPHTQHAAAARGRSTGMPSTRERLAAKLGMGVAFRGRGGATAAVAAASTTRRHDRATGITTTTRRTGGGRTVTVTRTPAGASTGRIDASARANADARRDARAVPHEEEEL